MTFNRSHLRPNPVGMGKRKRKINPGQHRNTRHGGPRRSKIKEEEHKWSNFGSVASCRLSPELGWPPLGPTDEDALKEDRARVDGHLGALRDGLCDPGLPPYHNMITGAPHGRRAPAV